jgi:small subunit ribosomal protein S27Ae
MSENLEEKPREEKEKGKTEKRKKKEKGVFSLYKIENNQIIRLQPTCERCGPGYFMADHGDRYTCGHCGFTRYKPVENKK